MTDIANSLVAFSDFTFDLEKLFLRKQGKPVALKRQSAALLALLLKTPGEVVSREEIRDFIWKDRLIEFDQGINACVRDIRQALGDDPRKPKFIETHPRVGYRFLGRVKPAETAPRSARWATGISVTLVAAALIAIALGTFGPLGPAQPAGDEVERIAVMPFSVLEDGQADSKLAERLTDLMVSSLAESQSRARVISAHDLFGDSRPAPGMGDVSRWLEADYLLAGGIHQQDGVLMLSLRLVRSEGYVHLWTGSFPIENDPLPLSMIVQEIVSAMDAEWYSKHRE